MKCINKHFKKEISLTYYEVGLLKWSSILFGMFLMRICKKSQEKSPIILLGLSLLLAIIPVKKLLITLHNEHKNCCDKKQEEESKK